MKKKRMKLFVSLLSAAVMASTTVLGAAAAHYKGDIDRDDKVTVSDVVTIQKFLACKSALGADKYIYADMNDDGKINVFDLVLAKRVALGKAPAEEVPSLTTPVVTTTTPVTSTTISTTVSTTTTPKVTTVTTTKPEETTTTTTITTVTEAETTTIETTVTETETTTEETTTTATETTVTETEATTTETTTTAVQTTLVVNAEKSIELDSTKELEKMTLTVDTSSNYKLTFLFGTDWNTYIDLYCNDGVLTAQYGTLIESVEITDNEVIITFKSGLKVDMLTLYNNNSTITILNYNVKYVGDETDIPAETTATTATEAETTTTTVATTVTETETTAAEETTTVTEVTTTATEPEETTTTVSTETETTQTGVAGTDVNRAMLFFAYSDSTTWFSQIGTEDAYTSIDNEVLMPEIKGDGTYTARFVFHEAATINSSWCELRILGANGTRIDINEYPELALAISGFKVNGVETTKSLDSATITIGNWTDTSVDLLPLFETYEGVESIEVTFTITGIE